MIVGCFPPRTTEDNLDYQVDWSAWLQPGETIVGQSVNMSQGDATVSTISVVGGTSVFFWLSAGTASITWQRVLMEVTTSAGRVREIELQIEVFP